MRFRRTNMIAYLHDASTLNKSASQTEKLGPPRVLQKGSS